MSLVCGYQTISNNQKVLTGKPKTERYIFPQCYLN